jgi:hypothetical protein
MNQSIFPTKIYDGVPLRLVPHAPDNGYLFYVSFDGSIGLRIAPNGKQALVNATTDTTPNSKYNANRKQRYLHFAHPWNSNEQILVSHAVYRAWSGKPIPLYHQIHHLNGITTDNRFDNLLCVLFREHRSIADARQSAIKAAVPDGDLTRVPYDVLRRLQAPRVLPDADFPAELQRELAKLNLVSTIHGRLTSPA